METYLNSSHFNGTLYCTYIIIKEDSVIVLQEKFLFHGDVSGLTAAIIEYKGIRYRFYVEPGDIHLYIDSQKPYELKLKGTTVDDDLKAMSSMA
ncbi:DUF4369 domain-containing protein [Prevotella brevis]|uniref:DUF4369 domain-containing protein n=1 Tax=Xylanibacter brevis TaxID=83231 RepID=UPI0009DCD46A